MTGSLQQKNGKYYVVARVKDNTGKLKQKWVSTGIPTKGNNKRRAEAKMREILTRLEAEQGLTSEDMPFSAWLDKWLEIREASGDIREITLYNYRLSVNKHMKPYFDTQRLTLKTIKRRDIEDYFISRRCDGLGADTVRKHRAIIGRALEEACRREYISHNPVDGIRLPKGERHESRAYSEDEARALLDALDGEVLKPAVILGIFYGLRRSEVCGLRWRDIDFDNHQITICNTVVRAGRLIEAEQTKSAASRRTLFMVPQSEPYLMEMHKQYMLRMSKPSITAFRDLDGHVCVDEDGKPLSPDDISRDFPKLLERHNLPPIHYHELRHTTGSLLYYNGLSAKEVQEYLGHSDIHTTLAIYVHTDARSKEKAAHIMDSLF